ncbi:hypothetical protein Mapa_014350 [Marchantia paleacea]|nr:hypothetical protein Mapa_014350 [Marchantia paleacea]
MVEPRSTSLHPCPSKSVVVRGMAGSTKSERKANTKAETTWVEGRDIWWQDVIPSQSSKSEVEWVDAEDPLFLLYTSGSTGKPKGVLHSTGGYMCTVDCGWITGHSYLTYGPLLNGATVVNFEGVLTYPDSGRCWEIVDKYNVPIFYTAPTAIRALMRAGDKPVKKHSRKSLRVLGSVGEPITPAACKWYYEVVGDSRCPISDTWWQTETGGFMILCLVLGHGWLFGDHPRHETIYYAPFKEYYFSGNRCHRDKDGYYWLTGRVDDVISVTGHRIGSAEVESPLVHHPMCAEAAVVGYDHEVKGQGIYAFVTLVEGVEYEDKLRKDLIAKVRSQIGPFAAPDIIH